MTLLTCCGLCHSGTQGAGSILTVGTSVDLHSQADLPARIPLPGHEADEAGSHGVQELVVHHAVSIRVPGKGLQGEGGQLRPVTATHVGENPRALEQQVHFFFFSREIFWFSNCFQIQTSLG